MTDFDNKIDTIKTWLGTGSINFFGRQFSGKDIQATILAKHLDAAVIGGGEIIRNEAAPQYVKDMLASGELAPTEEYRNIIIPYFKKQEFSGKPIMLSSVGRMNGEESAIIAATNDSGHPQKAVVYLEISEDESMKRMLASPSRNRLDDTEEKLNKRLKFFKESTIPVIEAYRSLGILITVDAMSPEDKVFGDIVDRLYDFATQSS